MIYSKAATAPETRLADTGTTAIVNDRQPSLPTLPSLTEAILVPEQDADLHLFRARRAVLSDLLKLSTALDDGVVDLSETLLRRFCGNLSRYLSVSHYRAFQTRSAQTTRYLALASTTREVMRFCDRFGNGRGVPGEPLPAVRQQLGQLAMTLETRFELEDDLISNDRFATTH
ncbi:MAG: Rsd/AlgQ family anti-sigma factor [Pseudomonadota bacterium]